MKIVLFDSKYNKFVPKIKASAASQVSGESVWASFETRLVKAGVSVQEARFIASNRYQSLIASCTNKDDLLD